MTREAFVYSILSLNIVLVIVVIGAVLIFSRILHRSSVRSDTTTHTQKITLEDSRNNLLHRTSGEVRKPSLWVRPRLTNPHNDFGYPEFSAPSLYRDLSSLDVNNSNQIESQGGNSVRDQQS